MICAGCGRSTPVDPCDQCKPSPPQPRWYVLDAGGGFLEWNPELKIMETTRDARYATSWRTEQQAKNAASFFQPIWDASGRGTLSVMVY